MWLHHKNVLYLLLFNYILYLLLHLIFVYLCKVSCKESTDISLVMQILETWKIITFWCQYRELILYYIVLSYAYAAASLLNRVPCMLKTCSRVNVSYVLTCLRFDMPCVLRCSYANVPCVLMCSCANQRVLRIRCSQTNVSCVLTCSRANVPWVLTFFACQHGLLTYAPMCQRVFRAHVLT